MSEHSLKVLRYFFSVIILGCIVYWTFKANWAMTYWSALWLLVLWIDKIKKKFRDKNWYSKLRAIYKSTIFDTTMRALLTVFLIATIYWHPWAKEPETRMDNVIRIVVAILIWLPALYQLYQKKSKIISK